MTDSPRLDQDRDEATILVEDGEVCEASARMHPHQIFQHPPRLAALPRPLDESSRRARWRWHRRASRADRRELCAGDEKRRPNGSRGRSPDGRMAKQRSGRPP